MIHLEKIDRSEWNSLFAQVPVTNLLQSWAYGEMKKSTGSWEVDRLRITSSEKTIGLVQVLKKKIFPKLELVRINRGPLFVSANMTESEIKNCYRAVLGHLGLFYGRLTFLAPEIWNCQHSSDVLSSAKKWFFLRQKGWTSSLIDLRPSIESIRQTLSGKWRNQLVSAEKKNLNIVVNPSFKDIQWMYTAYQNSMRIKNFVGIPLSAFKELHGQLEDQCTLITAAIPGENCPFAAIFIAEHGSTATYLIGVNENRNVTGATNLLLWTAITYLKDKGLCYFDLGGLDERKNPGITHFKRGMNGKEYSLLGEFIIL